MKRRRNTALFTCQLYLDLTLAISLNRPVVSQPSVFFRNTQQVRMEFTSINSSQIIITKYTIIMSPLKRSSWKCQLLLLVIQLPWTVSFVLPSSSARSRIVQSSEFSPTCSRLLAKRSSSGPGPKSKKKNKGKPATPKGKQKNSSSSNKANPQKKQSSTPPWQVMSAKEAKLNIEQEKERRKLAQQGIHQPQSSASSDGSSSSQQVTLSKSFLSAADQRFLKWKRFHPSTTPNIGLRFVGAFLNKRLPPSLGVPEVAFLGRSNVGKSSLLNRLTSTLSSSTTQARVGKTPGATASVNLYALAKYSTSSTSTGASSTDNTQFKDLLGLADLPGFGYAKLSKELQESVQEAAENYLNKRRELALGILLVDVRRDISDNDRAVLAALYDMGVPLLVVATKLDKLKNDTERTRQLQTIQQGLGLPEGQPLAVSSVTGEGVKQLWNILLEACETSVVEFRQTYDDDVDKLIEDDGDAYEPGEAFASMDDDDEELAYDMGYDWIHGGDFGVYEDENDDDDGFYDSNLDYDENAPPSSDDDDWYAEKDMHDFGGANTMNPPRTGEIMKSLKQRAREMERRGEL